MDALVSVPTGAQMNVGQFEDIHSFHSFLSLLARTTPTSSTLQQLCLANTVAMASTAELLSHALVHHSAISSLNLRMALISSEPSFPGAVAAPVLHALPRLSGLSSLHLSLAIPNKHHAVATIADVQALTAAISSLPRLAYFYMDTSLDDIDSSAARIPSPRKRPRLLHIPAVGCGDNPSLDPVIAALSTAPSLTYLHLGTHVHEPGSLLIPCTGITGPFASLRCIELSYSQARPGEKLEGCDFDVDGRIDSAAAIPVSSLPALKSIGLEICGVDFRAPFVNSAMRQVHGLPAACACITLNRVRPSSLDDIETNIASLRGLSSLNLELHPCKWLHASTVQAAVRGIAQLTALTALTVLLPGMGEDSDTDDSDDDLGVLDTVLQPLESLRELCELRFESKLELADNAGDEGAHVQLAMPLSSLTQLTQLDMLGHVPPYGAHELAHQLTWLTGLRVLKVVFEQRSVEDVRVCLSKLTALTRVCVEVRPIDGALVRVLAECFGLMPGLQNAEYTSFDTNSTEDVAAVDWVLGLLHLPPWGTYCYTGIFPPRKHKDFDAVKQQLRGRGAIVCDSLCDIDFGYGRVITVT